MSEEEQVSDLLAARRAKLERLRAQGIDPFPHAFPGVTPAARRPPAILGTRAPKSAQLSCRSP